VNGYCYLLRTYDIRRDEPATVQRTIMFDCGSQSYWDLGESVIVPALKYLGVTRIDAMFLSHADIDHYGGSLDVIAKVPVDRVYVPPQMLTEAQSHPDRAPAFLIAQLKAHGVPVTAVVRGWSRQWANCGATMIWPPPDLSGVRANDTSLVMKVRAGEHRILFTGDVQGYAMSALLDADAGVRAHVCELPHHGSFVNAAPLFLHRAAPRFVLQSSARDRLYHDRWADHFRNDAAQRLITANLGMVELRLHADGTITWSSFRNTATCPVNRAAPVAGTPPQ
jgi:competence protein ComEC